MSANHPIYSTKVLKALEKLHKKLPRKTDPLIRGCLVVMARVCGGKNCRCLKGYKHHSLYLARSLKGQTRMTYIPKQAEEEVKKGVFNYRKAKLLLDRLSSIHLRRLKRKNLP
jgi:hypothetical protein